MGNNAPIGVFDSGIGGLTVVKELVALMPHEQFIYFGDTARTPYGSRPPAQIVEFMHQILQFLASQQVKLAVIACNTITAYCFDPDKARYKFPVVGNNTGVKLALATSHTKRIGVMATQATVASGKHLRELQALEDEAVLFPQACPKFVPLIESGQVEGPAIVAAAKEYLAPLQAAGVDTIILGCTHFPFIIDVLSKVAGPEIQFIDPARATALDAQRVLAASDSLAYGSMRGSSVLSFSAPTEQAQVLANYLLGDHPGNIKLINLQDFAC